MTTTTLLFHIYKKNSTKVQQELIITKFWVPRVVFVLSAVLGPMFCADSKNCIRFCSTGQDLFL